MTSEDTFNIMFWTLLASMLLTRGFFQFRVWRTGERVLPDRAAKQREGFWARAVEGVFSLLLVALILHFCFRGGRLRAFAFPAPRWLRWVGLALGVTSVGLFAWTHAVLGRFWSTALQLRAGHALITAGPYARIRHPMYTAILGWLTSLGLVAASGVPLVFAALGALNFMLRIPPEEKMMLQRFGDEYRAYMKRTGRLLPV
jgi:protein-S-isoprenylcysteine O-methyltransferase Ste14